MTQERKKAAVGFAALAPKPKGPKSIEAPQGKELAAILEKAKKQTVSVCKLCLDDGRSKRHAALCQAADRVDVIVDDD